VFPWNTLFLVYINDITATENDINVAISVCADDINSAVSGSLHIAVAKLKKCNRPIRTMVSEMVDKDY
jgi:hypothetical protein